MTSFSNIKSISSVIGFGLGLFTHLGFFIHGEWHIQAPLIFVLHTLLYTTFLVGSSVYGGLWTAGLLMSIFYLAALLSSILIYRIFFHQLTRAGFKGPFYMRLSKLFHVWKCRNSTNHLMLDELQKKYGDFIRTGPSEITIFHPDVFAATDGPKTSCIKSDWYDLLHPDSSLLTTRGRVLHDTRRREWKEAFSPPALVHHFIKTAKHVNILLTVIEGHIAAAKPCEMRNLFYWLGFDLMGDFVFSKSFDMLVNQEWHYMIVRLQRALSLLGPVSPAPWLIQIAFHATPRIYQIGDWFGMTAWTNKQIGARLDAGFQKQPGPDLVHYLLEKNDEPRTAEAVRRMRGDSLNAMVAGSEPIPIVLLALFAELAQKPQYVETIHAELAEVNIGDAKILAALPHLNAAIQEALREDCFEQAREFVPERWTTRPEMVRNIAAYSPWGTAHHSCIARTMAFDVLRITTAQIIKKYKFRLAPGETGRRVLEDMKDQLAPNPGHLTLRFEKR